MQTRLSPRHLGTGLAVIVVGLSAACSNSADSASTAGSESEAEAAVEITVAPEDGASEVRPELPITVTADGGTLTEVTVSTAGATATSAPDADEPQIDLAVAEDTAEGEEVVEGVEGETAEPTELDAVTGTFNDDATEWASDWTLPPGGEVTVTASGENADGEAVEVSSEFSTLQAEPGQQLDIVSNFPSSDQEVGVGMPIIFNFDQPVHNKEQVEAAVEVISEEPTEGAFNWFGDTMAVFRVEEYWEPNQDVTVNLRLAGVRGSADVYGVSNYQIDFTVGREQISHVDDNEFTMVVERDGEQIKEFPISNGDATTEAYTTTSGHHLLMEKYSHLIMDSATVGIPEGHPDYYYLDVDYAVRYTNSGMFTHSAPWNGELGQANRSHGCTNMSPEDAKWFYDESLMGDPFIVEGTDRELAVDNGWGFYERDWSEWVELSELGEPHVTDGTTPAAPALDDDEESEDAEDEGEGEPAEGE